MIMLGTRKPRQQATLTKKNQISEIFFRFRNPKERVQNPGSFFSSLVLVSVKMVTAGRRLQKKVEMGQNSSSKSGQSRRVGEP